MDLRKVDLNLLVALDILLEERKVVSAAERLDITQPSASAALERCRQLFGDRLLVRSGRGMELTARGQALRQPIRELVDHMRSVLGEPGDDIATVQRAVRLVASDIPALMVLQTLWEELRTSAPSIDLVLLPWRESDDIANAFARDRADLAITVLPQTGSSYRRVELFQERYCIAMRHGHPAAENFDLDAWLSHPHILVSAKGARRSPLDDQLGAIGRKRRVAITVPSFLMVPPLLAASDLISLMPRYCTRHDHSLHYCEPPIALEGFPLHLAWATRSDGDVAIQHVATLIRDFLI